VENGSVMALQVLLEVRRKWLCNGFVDTFREGVENGSVIAL